MARLRFNGLTASLGANLTTSGTAATFGAALTHSGGVAVPTLGSGDYIPLTLLDSSGSVSEIVNLTAYTSGATTGTIARAQEGTTAVAHSAGDKAIHAPTRLDVVPGSRVDDPADPSWSGNLGYDVEFEDDNAGALPAGWSWVNQAVTSATLTNKFGVGLWNLPTPGGPMNGDGSCQIVRSLPTQASWTATAKISIGGRFVNGNRASLVLRDSTSGKYVDWGFNSTNTGPGGPDGTWELNQWTSLNAYSANWGTNINDTPNRGGFYLRLRRNSATSWDFEFSPDGVGWSAFADRTGVNISTFLTPDSIGFHTAAGRSTPNVLALHWFRVR